MVRQIGVVFVIALVRMMFQMINAKPHRAWREVRKIGNDRHHFVPARTPQNQVVRCVMRSEEHTSELQSHSDLVCRLLLEKKKHSCTTHPSPGHCQPTTAPRPPRWS